MSPKTRKSSRRRPRRAGQSRASIRLLFMTIALPALFVLLWFGQRFLSSSPSDELVEPATDRVVETSPSTDSAAAETPRIERVLLDAGIERDRMRWDNGHLVVETFDPREVVIHHIRNGMPDSEISEEGELIVVKQELATDRVRVVELHRDTEADGFVAILPKESEPKLKREPVKGARKIVLILDDVGYENQPLEDAATIDARLSFAVIPGTPRAKSSAEFLASRGFEILCHLPMEPLDFPNVSPGENAIFTAMSDDEIRVLADANISSIPHVKGVNNHMGSRATRDRRVMERLAEILVQKDIYFIDSRTAGSSVAAQVTRDARVPTGTRDVFLDDDPSEASVRRQLRQLVRLSESRQYVIGIGHVYPTTVRVLREEIPRLADAGYEFLFASDVLR